MNNGDFIYPPARQHSDGTGVIVLSKFVPSEQTTHVTSCAAE